MRVSDGHQQTVMTFTSADSIRTRSLLSCTVLQLALWSASTLLLNPVTVHGGVKLYVITIPESEDSIFFRERPHLRVLFLTTRTRPPRRTSSLNMKVSDSELSGEE